jgi:hypothetical protein
MCEFCNGLDRVSHVMQYFENKDIKYEYEEKFLHNNRKVFIVIKK